MASTTDNQAKLPHVSTVDGVRRWDPQARAAFVGLFHVQRKLVRELDADLERRHGLSFTAFEVLIRLAGGEGHKMRLSELAASADLSLSRISRVADQLERQGWIERRACPEDGRGVHAVLTGDGLAKLREAQETHFAQVEQLYFGGMSEAEIATLAAVFERFGASGPATACGE